MGEPGRRGLARYVRLLLNVAHANDVRCTINHDSTGVNLHGFPSDIAVTKALYESLLVQMVADCEHYLSAGARDTKTVWDARRRRYVDKPVATITARLAFYEAYAWRVGERLDEARQAALTEAGAGADPAGPGSTETALALRQKELEVHDFFAEALRRNNVRGTWTADRRSSVNAAPTAATAGVHAAERAPPVRREGPRRGGVTRLSGRGPSGTGPSPCRGRRCPQLKWSCQRTIRPSTTRKVPNTQKSISSGPSLR
ncbi:hypothetical protein [Nocardioides sp. TF02-7]|uniref:DUF7168 domain-containing protein n=1 Tax=Nocardioides sp. TF02-7 TaxID=2917724 RepID=UPI001F0694D1|nr:hypothetical protein [Nocardioides sp. TF02-7]UMG91669.1 hypothetical protein MF408_16490 [Nocardioides sp. TF02-7]